MYELARRSIIDHKFKNAKKYYEMVIIEDPMNWEPAFYIDYTKAILCDVDDIETECGNMTRAMNRVFSLLKEADMDSTQQDNVLNDIARKIIYLSDRFLERSINDEDYIISIGEYGADSACMISERFISCAHLCYDIGDKFITQFSRFPQYAIYLWKQGASIDATIILKNKMLRRYDNEEKVVWGTYEDKIRKYDVSYVKPQKNKKENWNLSNIFKR